MITLSVDTKKWDKLKKDLQQLDRIKLQLGWFGTHYGSENDNLPHAYVAAINEEGTEKIPPRPFMRVGLKQELKTDTKAFAMMIQSVASGKSALSAAKTASPAFVAMLKKIMNEWSSPPNSPRTVAEKGFNNPLIDTAELRDSIQVKVEGR